MVACYWFSSAAGHGRSLLAQELRLGSRNLFGRGARLECAVFRVSVTGRDESYDAAEVERFVRALLGVSG